MRPLVGSIAIILTLSAAALADTCPTCGSDLTDKGRCPYCQPKPEANGS